MVRGDIRSAFALAIALFAFTELPDQSRGSELKILASFNGTNGSDPCDVVLDANGNLYGNATAGGVNGVGTLFEIAKGTNTINTLATFNNVGIDGFFPDSVMRDANGNLYGITGGGGSYSGDVAGGGGTVFELASGSNTIATVTSFTGRNGFAPSGGVTMDASGNLFGTTIYGGSTWIGGEYITGLGTVWEITKGSNTMTTLASFNGSNGMYPYSGVTLDADGNLYGTTPQGGANGNYGTIWEIAKGSKTITDLASFNGTNGSHPLGNVTIDGSGNIYGVTSYGGSSNDGTVWELVKGSNTIIVLASFNGSNGSIPYAGVTLGAYGNIYGTTLQGGAYDVGTLWEIIKGSNSITTLVSFDGTDGANPDNSLTLGPGGTIYGTTQNGGANDDGTVFQFSVPEPASLVMSVISLVFVHAFMVVRGRLRTSGRQRRGINV